MFNSSYGPTVIFLSVAITLRIFQFHILSFFFFFFWFNVQVSLPDIGDKTIAAMNMMYSVMEANMSFFNLWQVSMFYCETLQTFLTLVEALQYYSVKFLNSYIYDGN